MRRDQGRQSQKKREELPVSLCLPTGPRPCGWHCRHQRHGTMGMLAVVDRPSSWVLWLLSLNSWDEFLLSLLSLDHTFYWVGQKSIRVFPEDGTSFGNRRRTMNEPEWTFWPIPCMVLLLRAFYQRCWYRMCLLCPQSHMLKSEPAVPQNVTYLEVGSSLK